MSELLKFSVRARPSTLHYGLLNYVTCLSCISLPIHPIRRPPPSPSIPFLWKDPPPHSSQSLPQPPEEATSAEQGTDQLPRPELMLRDAQADYQDGKGEGDGDGPEEPLWILHVADIDSVHAEEAGDESEREKDDGDGGEDVDCFVVVFTLDLGGEKGK